MAAQLMRNEDAGEMTGSATSDNAQVALAQARQMLHFMRVSRDAFPAMRDLADHPGWEIVLNIFIAGGEERSINTADLCEGTGLWRPLAIRYVEMLFERGLIDREISAGKPDSWPLTLTKTTEDRLLELFSAWARGFPGSGL